MSSRDSAWVPPWQQTWRRPKPRETTPLNSAIGGAVRDLIAAAHEDDPFGSFGELVASEPPGPTRVLQEFTIPPADWDAEERERLEREALDKQRDARAVLGLPEPQTAERPPIPAPPWKKEENDGDDDLG